LQGWSNNKTHRRTTTWLSHLGYYDRPRISQSEVDEASQSFHGTLTGKNYSSEAAMRDAEKKELMSRTVRTPEELAFENMPIDQFDLAPENWTT
jgi:hypothetical protein